MAVKHCARCGHEKAITEFRVVRNERHCSHCKQCEAEYKRLHYIKNAERIKAKARAWSAENKDRKAETDRLYREKNKARAQQKSRDYYLANKEACVARSVNWRKDDPSKARANESKYREKNRDKCNQRISDWKKNNRERLTFYFHRRRAAELKAIPKWADEKEIARIYEEANKMKDEQGRTYHVDHVVPLLSKIVCGLHCPANLQIAPPIDNLRKNNRYWPDMP